jgi:hypothetical protein
MKGGISDFSVHHIIKDTTGVRKIALWWVPHHLTQAQNWYRHANANLNLQRYHKESNALPCHTVGLDETHTWTFGNKLAIKQIVPSRLITSVNTSPGTQQSQSDAEYCS